jgi:hypothetical protein
VHQTTILAWFSRRCEAAPREFRAHAESGLRIWIAGPPQTGAATGPVCDRQLARRICSKKYQVFQIEN